MGTFAAQLRARLERFASLLIGDPDTAQRVTDAVIRQSASIKGFDKATPEEKTVTLFRAICDESFWSTIAVPEQAAMRERLGADDIKSVWRSMPPVYRKVLLLVQLERFDHATAARIAALPDREFETILKDARRAFGASSTDSKN